MLKVCFIVLHYKAEDYTKQCVDSIIKINDMSQCNILIYDNGSNNGSFEKLEEYYHNNSMVETVKSTDNLGFTGGINAAYKIAKKWNPMFIVALNNDTEIWQKDFVSRLENLYSKEHPYIVGVDVFNPKIKIHQSPLYDHILSLDEAQEIIAHCQDEIDHIDETCQMILKVNRNQRMKKFLPYWLLNIKRFIRKDDIALYQKEKIENAVINGSCIIATKDFIENESVLLEPDTKFYGEEAHLALKCKTLGYKEIYSNNLQIIHWGGAATEMDATSLKNKLLNERKRTMHAFEIYVNTIKNNPWEKR